MDDNNTENNHDLDLVRFWWIPVVGLPLTVGLTLLVRRFVRDVLAMPIAQMLWFVEMAFKSIPQVILWFGLLLIVIVIALQSLTRTRGRASGKPQPSTPRQGRVALWTDRIDLLLKGNYSRHRFGYYIGRLILDVLSHEEQISYRDVELMLEQETLTLPPLVEEYLMSRLQPSLVTRPSLIERVKQFLGLERRPTSSLNREIESVIEFLEAETGETKVGSKK